MSDIKTNDFSSWIENNYGKLEFGTLDPDNIRHATYLSNKQDVMSDPMSYDVVMELDEINVLQTGIAYNPGDTVVIEGDGNTITVEPTLSEEGCIIDVPLTDRGLGFTSIPTITINTETGAAANLHPYLRIKYRGKDNIAEVLDQVTQDQIVSVVDCVGKFNV